MSSVDEDSHSRLRDSAAKALSVAFAATALACVALEYTLTLGGDTLARSAGVFAMTGALVLQGLSQHPYASFGSANQLTLTRACFIALLAAFLGEAQATEAAVWVLITCATIVACSDALDGHLARASGTQSRFGARFDMEVDAAFMFVLSALVYQQDKAGLWVLAIGAMRYLFVIAGWLVPALAQELPPSRRRQTVCVVQVVVLIASLAPIFPRGVVELALLAALLLLTYSFVRDGCWLLRTTHSQETHA